jgi:hypothetical protein
MKGNLRKMTAQLGANTIQYTLRIYDPHGKVVGEQPMNELVGKDISISYSGKINCVNCGTITKKSFGQGFCYKCFISAPESSECIIRPELCRGHLGEGRDVEWEQKNHNQPHIVYLAVSDVVKVGVTRATQIPTRWIDQGAAYAIRLAEVPYRQLAGLIEVALKSEFTDKTNWRKMLRNDIDSNIDLLGVKWELEELLPNDFSQYMTENDEIIELNYPVLEFPEKVTSMGLEKQPEIKGKLMGIKGQYLILDGGRVFNVRNHSGFEVQIGIIMDEM